MATILNDPQRNRSTAFTYDERAQLGLVGRLPAAVETLDQQVERCWAQINRKVNAIAKYIYLEALHERNEVLYFAVLTRYLTELMPIVYAPTVGEAIKRFSRDFRQSRAVYLQIDRPQDVEASFTTLGLGPDDVDLLVVSDSEGILGIGDWGVNGVEICVGKLAVYTAAAGVNPNRVLAVNLDVGTDNAELLDDPSYLGLRHPRVRGQAYDDFVDLYLATAARLFPNALLHFEDFGARNARRILEANADKYRIFNDDMQGTGATVVAACMSGMKVTGTSFADQRLVVFGAGTAGSGMADQIAAGMVRDGLTPEEARKRIWLIDRYGLVTDAMTDLPSYQQPYVRPAAEVADWAPAGAPIDLLSVVTHAKPTILIGTSTVHGAFNQAVVEAMSAGVERPIILPLSNPTERIEAMPGDVIAWSKGKALVAVGIPSEPITYGDTTFTIGQGNNALLYPGLGLGTIVARADHVTAGMLLAAGEAVASQVDMSEPGAALLPPVKDLRTSSALVAAAVVRAAIDEGIARVVPDDVDAAVATAMWQPVYATGAS